jgi:hypothetical protein
LSWRGRCASRRWRPIHRWRSSACWRPPATSSSYAGRRQVIRWDTKLHVEGTQRRRGSRCSTARASWPPISRSRGCCGRGTSGRRARLRRCRRRRRGRRVDRARAAVAAARRGRGAEDPDGIAHAARDVVIALAGRADELGAAADVFDRGARPPRGAPVRNGPSAAGLRRVARQLVHRRRMVGGTNDPGPAAVALTVSLAALLREIAGWQQDRDREHQAAASRAAADVISSAN